MNGLHLFLGTSHDVVETSGTYSEEKPSANCEESGWSTSLPIHNPSTSKTHPVRVCEWIDILPA